MAFGRALDDIKLPIWRHAYIDYNRLKTEIKLIRAKREGGKVLPGDCTSAFGCMTHQIDSINQFYKFLSNAVWGEVSKYHVWYNGPKYLEENPEWVRDIDWEATDEAELQFFLGLLLQCRNDLGKVLWFGKVNISGFQKILHKFSMLEKDLEFPGWMAGWGEHFRSELVQGLCSTCDELRYRLSRVEVMIERVTQVLSTGNFTSQSSLMVHNLARYWCSDLVNDDTLDLHVACTAVREDDSIALQQFLEDALDRSIQATIDTCIDERVKIRIKVELAQQRHSLILVLTQFAIIHVSKACLDMIIELMEPDHDLCMPKYEFIASIIDGIMVNMSHEQLLAEHFESHSIEPATSQGRFSEKKNYLQCLLDHILSMLKDTESRRIVLFNPDPYWAYFPIHNAARYGLVDACRLILDYMPLVSKFEFLEPALEGRYDQSTPLTLAASHGHTDVCEAFVEASQEIWNDAPKDSWITSMWNGEDVITSIYSYPTLWSLISLHGAFQNYQGAYGETLLYAAASSGNCSAVSYLLQNKVDANLAENSRGWTPLIVASVKGHQSIVQLLIEGGANAECRDRLGWRAFEHAVSNGYDEIVDMLSRQLEKETLNEFKAASSTLPSESM